MKTQSACARPIAIAATSRRMTSEPTTHMSRCGRPQSVHAAALQGQARRYSDAGRRGRTLPAGRHHLHGQQAYTNTKALRAQFTAEGWRVVQRDAVRQGTGAAAQGLWRRLGYINFVGTPVPRVDEAKKLIYLDIDIDEGKPFYVSRIEFTGNTITRDKVIRRELLLEEGQVYNSRLWELSILRLNQLELLRDAEGRSGLREPSERRRRNRRSAAEAEGEGQELHRPERRHQRPVRARSSASTTRPTTSSAWARRSRCRPTSATCSAT